MEDSPSRCSGQGSGRNTGFFYQQLGRMHRSDLQALYIPKILLLIMYLLQSSHWRSMSLPEEDSHNIKLTKHKYKFQATFGLDLVQHTQYCGNNIYLPVWLASIEPVGIQDELVKNPEYVLMFLQKPFLPEGKNIFSLYSSHLKYVIPDYFFKTLPQHLIENEQNICCQQLPNI